MSRFRGNHDGKKDAKNRVSIPSAFRTALKGDANPETLQIVLRPSHNFPCIEGWSPAGFDAQEEMLTALPRFSVEEETLALALNSVATDVETDREGRIVLPAKLIEYAGLGDRVVFLGAGSHFQIWEPEAAERRVAEALSQARLLRMTLPAQLAPGQRGTP